MPTETENDLTEQELSDVFNQMADTFDTESGLIKSPEVITTEVEEQTTTEADPEPAASAQQQVQESADVFDFDTLPPAAQKVFKELEHKHKSDSGRVGALQKQLKEQHEQLEQLQLQGKGNSQAAQKLEGDIEKKENDLDGLVEELPELQVFVDELKSLRQRVDGVSDVVQNQVITPGQARAAQEAEAAEQKALNETHIDRAEIESNPKFWSWVDAQHDAVKKLADSDKSSDVSALFTLYKNSNPIIPAATPAAAPKINRNIEDMMTLPSNKQAATSGVDESSAFNWAADQIGRGKL